jgi:transcriptional regulator with XRE-family HTH domain
VLTKTLADGLDRYEIGPKVRALRLRKKMGLVELGKHTSLSPALLSKLERGRLFPTLPTLLRIALVFGVGLEHFFLPRDRAEPVIVRKGDRLKFPSEPGLAKPAFHFESLDFPATERPMSGYFVEFDAEDSAADATHQHAGAELIYVIDGRLGVSLDGAEHVLDAGDSMHFRGDRPHAYRRHGTRRCRAIVVTADQKG